MDQISGFHGTIYQIDEWRLPTADERSSRGPAAICLTPDRDIAALYCNAGDGGTEEIARLIAKVAAARIDLVLDQPGQPKRYLPAYRALADQLAALEREWREGRHLRRERIYRSAVSPKNVLEFDAEGRPFYNLNGESGQDVMNIWALARQARDAGHDCMIVRNVVDPGSIGASSAGTTIFVFDPSILSAPESVQDMPMTFQQVVARTNRRAASRA